MARTLNGIWSIDPLFEVRDGAVIGTGKQQNLRELNRVIFHDYARNGASSLAVLSVINRLTLPASYDSIAVGRVRIPPIGSRVRVSVYGDRCRVQLWVGLVLRATATQAAVGDAWASSSVSAPLALTPDSDGMVTLELRAEYTAAGSTGLTHVIVEDFPMLESSVPGAGANPALTGFVGMDDNAYDRPDDPLDVFQLQTLDENVRWLWRDRGRKHLHLYPRIGPVVRLSSSQWRLDGPYIMEAPIHAERLDVTLSLGTAGSASARVLEVLALTEYEQLESVISDRAVSLTEGTTTAHLNFRGLRMRPGQPVKVWVAFRSEIYSAVETTIDMYSHNTSQPHMLWCGRNATLEGTLGLPWGLCMVMKSEDLQTSRDPTIKGSLGYSAPEQVCDLACVPGIDTTGSGSDAALQVVISPSPSTGLTRAPMFAGVYQWWTGATNSVVYQPQAEVRKMVIGFLFGVFVDIGGEVPAARRKLARSGVLPAAGAVQGIGVRAATSTVQGTPAIIMRHGGARRLKPNATPSGKTIQYHGRYLYVQGDGGEDALWQIPLTDPNFGVGSGLRVRKLYGQFAFMCTLAQGRINEEEALVEVLFQGPAAAFGSARVRHFPTQGAQMSPTECDALVASQSTAIYATDPNIGLANAYTQEFTWPSEGEFRRGIWDYSPIFEANIPGSFPALVNAIIRPRGGARYATSMQLIVAGLHVWWGPRS
jgi:hypothetical protein